MTTISYIHMSLAMMVTETW